MRDNDRPDHRGDILSSCHDAPLDTSLSDGVLVGSCRECGHNVVRVNPRTGVEEYLDGASPWVYASLRPTGCQR